MDVRVFTLCSKFTHQILIVVNMLSILYFVGNGASVRKKCLNLYLYITRKLVKEKEAGRLRKGQEITY